MKFDIKHREQFWNDCKYNVVESGNGWRIERPCKLIPENVPELEELLDKFFKKRKKWE